MTKTPRHQIPKTERPELASRDELNAFLDRLAILKKDIEDDTKQREAIRSYLQQFDRQKLERLMGRAFADALKSPSQKLGTAKPPSSEKRKPATKKRKRPSKGR